MLIALLTTCSLLHAQDIDENRRCGEVVYVTATPDEGYRFARWSDGNTDNPRAVEVTEDISFTAIFEPDCDLPVIPVDQAYGWLLMLNVDSLHAAGLVFEEEQVRWYRIVDDTGLNDQYLTSGYFLTIGTPLVGTGDYYALLDLSATPDLPLCAEQVRSEVVRYGSTALEAPPGRVLSLHPTEAHVGSLIRLDGLSPEAETVVDVFDMAGKHIRHITTTGESCLLLQAEWQPGWYMVHVKDSTLTSTLKYVSVR